MNDAAGGGDEEGWGRWRRCLLEGSSGGGRLESRRRRDHDKKKKKKIIIDHTNGVSLIITAAANSAASAAAMHSTTVVGPRGDIKEEKKMAKKRPVLGGGSSRSGPPCGSSVFISHHNGRPKQQLLRTLSPNSATQVRRRRFLAALRTPDKLIRPKSAATMEGVNMRGANVPVISSPGYHGRRRPLSAGGHTKQVNNHLPSPSALCRAHQASQPPPNRRPLSAGGHTKQVNIPGTEGAPDDEERKAPPSAADFRCWFCASKNIKWSQRCGFCGCGRVNELPKIVYLVENILSLHPDCSAQHISEKLVKYASSDNYASACNEWLHAKEKRRFGALLRLTQNVSLRLQHTVFRMLFRAWKANALNTKQRDTTLSFMNKKNPFVEQCFRLWRLLTTTNKRIRPLDRAQAELRDELTATKILLAKSQRAEQKATGQNRALAKELEFAKEEIRRLNNAQCEREGGDGSAKREIGRLREENAMAQQEIGTLRVRVNEGVRRMSALTDVCLDALDHQQRQLGSLQWAEEVGEEILPEPLLQIESAAAEWQEIYDGSEERALLAAHDCFARSSEEGEGEEKEAVTTALVDAFEEGTLSDQELERRTALLETLDTLHGNVLLGGYASDASEDSDESEYENEALQLVKEALGVEGHMANLDAVIARFREQTQLDRGNATPFYNLGNALKANGELDAAISAFREAVECDPDGVQCLEARPALLSVLEERDANETKAEAEQAAAAQRASEEATRAEMVAQETKIRALLQVQSASLCLGDSLTVQQEMDRQQAQRDDVRLTKSVDILQAKLYRVTSEALDMLSSSERCVFRWFSHTAKHAAEACRDNVGGKRTNEAVARRCNMKRPPLSVSKLATHFRDCEDLALIAHKLIPNHNFLRILGEVDFETRAEHILKASHKHLHLPTDVVSASELSSGSQDWTFTLMSYLFLLHPECQSIKPHVHGQVFDALQNGLFMGGGGMFRAPPSAWTSTGELKRGNGVVATAARALLRCENGDEGHLAVKEDEEQSRSGIALSSPGNKFVAARFLRWRWRTLKREDGNSGDYGNSSADEAFRKWGEIVDESTELFAASEVRLNRAERLQVLWRQLHLRTLRSTLGELSGRAKGKVDIREKQTEEAENSIYTQINTDSLALDLGVSLVEARQVESVLSEFAPEIKSIYKAYAMASCSKNIKQGQFVQMMRDCRLTNPKFPLSEIDLVFIKTANLNNAGGWKADATLTPAAFVEALVRVAHSKQKASSSGGGRKRKLQQFLKTMLESHLVPFASKSNAKEFRKSLETEAIKAVFNRFGHTLKQLFRRVAAMDLSSGADRADLHQTTMNEKEFLQLASEYGWIDGTLTITVLKQIFAAVQIRDGEVDSRPGGTPAPPAEVKNAAADEEEESSERDNKDDGEDGGGAEDPGDDSAEDDAGEIKYPSFLEALSAVCCYKSPDPYVVFPTNLERFIEKWLGPSPSPSSSKTFKRGGSKSKV